MSAPLINTDPGFRPHVDGTRISVQQIIEHHEVFHWPPEKIARAFRLTLAQVYAALAYYHEHKEEIDQALSHDRAEMQEWLASADLPDSVLMLVMTPQEVSEQFSISVEAVYQAIRRNRLPARQSGKTWLVLRRDAERLWQHRSAA